ncbi:MAG: NAD(P)/FAD-dependent oxidoreductase [Rhodothermales bacterium]|nr:NAD(P)/FAD-dependent oxidoreductase [Rhodothermales bacterium]
MTDPSLFDAIVIGGGPAGLSAALALGRSRRRVLVAASGPTRNASAEASHNVFTRDGTPPAELLRIGREQLAPYDVVIREEWAVRAVRIREMVMVMFASGERVDARGIVLATGVRDILPEVPGLAERWGRGVFHCPYCHGWEVGGRPLAVYGRGLDPARTLHLCRLIRGWSSDVILFTDGPAELPAADRARIERNGIVVREERIERLTGEGGELEAVVLEGGVVVPRGGLIVSPEQELRSDLPKQLGCPLTTHGRVEAGIGGQTAVPGVFVAGDIAPGMQSVVSAMASGTLAGAMLNHYLLEEEFVR